MTGFTNQFAAELDAAVAAASEAGRVVKDLYDRAAAATYTKTDGSLVTDADLAADRTVRAILHERFSADPILTEEGQDDPARLESARCWVVDPIDGTDQFVRRTGEFDVLVALVADGRPVAVAGCHPPSGLVLCAAAGGGAWIEQDGERRPLRYPSLADDAPIRLATSVWFGAPANLPILSHVAERVGAAPRDAILTGLSPRVFLPAADRAFDALIGVRADKDQTMAWEWDFAVADLVVHEAGGRLTDLWGNLHRYNKPDPRNVGGLVAAADPAVHARVLDALRPELAARSPDRATPREP